MKFRAISMALRATAIAVGTYPVAVLGAVGAPAEVPPASFTGPQFVDSDGCVFVRATLDGQVTWVPRVTRERQPVCGMEPTFTEAPATLAPVAAAPAPQPAKTATAKPTTTVAAAPKATPSPTPVAAPKAEPQLIRVECPGMQPVTYRYTAKPNVSLLCANVPGTPRAKVSYVYLDQSGTRRVPVAAAAPASAAKPVYGLPTPPSGYKFAFEKGRYNPNRGPRTATGDAEMNRVWTRDVPQDLVDPDKGRYLTQPAPQTQMRTSSKSPAATASHRYVQVGTFASPDNVRAAALRLQNSGLPVSTAPVTRDGRQLQVVLAGPFDTGQQVQAAVLAARRAGFGDAFPRH
ncbi:SPOR domain-containing protein [Tropicimonas aquimaris]|uniref:SPOR domain-containing protein n=1 Tax=Tropicimonas aquimaris TaxID=914152 RepID=A0ABW3IUA1_9RHOB